MRFSQRIGKTPVRDAIQIEQIDTKLENRLWNTILQNFFEEILIHFNYDSKNRDNIYLIIWTEFFGERADEIPSYQDGDIHIKGLMEYIKKWFLNSVWYEKFDFIEFLSLMDNRGFNWGFTNACNASLKKEMSGYRIIDEKIVQITSEEEIVEIEDALSVSSKWRPVSTHLSTALEYFSDRENPDYRNSIKESISAVEALCVKITGDKNATLGKVLNSIEKKYKIHSALKNAFSSLYGYTSDTGGIRHALLEDNIDVTMEDAKFMLVSCSAFINYLKVKIE